MVEYPVHPVHPVKPIEVIIDRADSVFTEARDISLWNKIPNVTYHLYSNDKELISLENKAMMEPQKKYYLLLKEENLNNYLNTFKNSCMKVLLQTKGQQSRRNLSNNVVFEGSSERINSFLKNPFKDRIEYP